MTDPEALFSLASAAVLPGWLLLACVPRWRHTARLVCAVASSGSALGAGRLTAGR